MEMTTYDMERQAAVPTAAPVGAVTLGYCLVPDQIRIHVPSGHRPDPATATPFGIGLGIATAVKPWTSGSDRQVNRNSGLMTTRSARRLGRTST